MKKFVFTLELGRHIDEHFVLEGESLEDPKLRERLVERITGIQDGSLEDDYFDDFKDNDTHGLTAYEIAREVPVPFIYRDVKAFMKKCKDERETANKRYKEQSDKELYERLKKKYEQ